MLKFAANLSFMFNEVPFLDRFAAARRRGLQGRRVSCFPMSTSRPSWPLVLPTMD